MKPIPNIFLHRKNILKYGKVLYHPIFTELFFFTVDSLKFFSLLNLSIFYGSLTPVKRSSFHGVTKLFPIFLAKVIYLYPHCKTLSFKLHQTRSGLLLILQPIQFVYYFKDALKYNILTFRNLYKIDLKHFRQVFPTLVPFFLKKKLNCSFLFLS